MRCYLGCSSSASSAYSSFLSIDFENVLSRPSIPMICFFLMRTDTAR